MVIETALRLFSERGYLAVRVEDIAREAGMSRATFYKYFSEREEILAALLTRLIDADADTEVDPGTDDGTDVPARVTSLARGITRRMLEQEQLARFVYSLPMRHDALLRGEQVHLPHAFQQLDRLLARAAEAGEVRADVPHETLRAHVHAAIEAAMRAWAAGRAPDALEALDQHLDLALHGVLARAQPAPDPRAGTPEEARGDSCGPASRARRTGPRPDSRSAAGADP